jgi:hypothetical protein
MILLTESAIKNEGYILIAENLLFKNFNSKTAKALGISKKQNLIKSWQLNVLWRLDWLKHKVFGKRRQLSKQLAKTLSLITKHDNSKIKTALDFEFTPVDESIKRVSNLYLKDLKN